MSQSNSLIFRIMNRIWLEELVHQNSTKSLPNAPALMPRSLDCVCWMMHSVFPPENCFCSTTGMLETENFRPGFHPACRWATQHLLSDTWISPAPSELTLILSRPWLMPLFHPLAVPRRTTSSPVSFDYTHATIVFIIHHHEANNWLSFQRKHIERLILY